MPYPKYESYTHTKKQLDEEEIQRRAFELFEARGSEHGHDLEDWLEAEHQLSEEKLRAA